MAKQTSHSAAADAAHALRDLINSNGDIPDAFWQNPFVLGFLFYYIHGVAGLTGVQADEYYDMPSAFIELCGEDLGIDVLERSLTFSMDQDPGYLAGLKAGDKYLAVVFGSKQYDNDPAVIGARKLAAAKAKDLPAGFGVAPVDIENTYLLETIFLSEVRGRLNMVTIN
ncbi:hypothetical protein ACFPL7_02075 [Dongia soli]|uniref:Uncharacterized protein n=1 Tax=Dongia soli TaxID=600628 RepID=A0ABU5EGM2_9PROT|nr:hypothetical protein [Dongia soli]MDY0885285.1 hypothetical protein [Dongia soli]